MILFSKLNLAINNRADSMLSKEKVIKFLLSVAVCFLVITIEVFILLAFDETKISTNKRIIIYNLYKLHIAIRL